MLENRELLIVDLNNLLRLNPDTGQLFWRKRDICWFRNGIRPAEMAAKVWNSRFADTEAFTAAQGRTGYRHGQIQGRAYLAHRVVFALHNGRWPDGDLDHRDGSKNNNAPANLREATRRQNQANVSGRGKSSTFRGVWWLERNRRWMVNGTNNLGKRCYLGSYQDEIAAARAYDDFAREQYGEFAKLNIPEQNGAVA